jgi:hypothetical protein
MVPAWSDHFRMYRGPPEEARVNDQPLWTLSPVRDAQNFFNRLFESFK